MSLALVEEYLGHAVELAIARDLVVFLRRHGGQAQFSDHLALQGSHRDSAQLHSWIAANLVTDLSVTALAARTGIHRANSRNSNSPHGPLLGGKVRLPDGDFSQGVKSGSSQ
ncbi:MAG: hypothetical protein GXP15_16545 [Gammaproteobacteria bacterium]|nr:hypothetical protein [Gammaproteobacteria bacterium]